MSQVCFTATRVIRFWSACESGLIPFNREARIFADGVPIFPESRGINNFSLAQRMVDALGPHYAVFLRRHGIVVVGLELKGLVYPRFSSNGPARISS